MMRTLAIATLVLLMRSGVMADVLVKPVHFDFPQRDFPVRGNPTSLVVADLDGDGKQDLAVATSQPSYVSVLMGKGDGTFKAAVNYKIATGSHFIVIADFNGDGKLDLAIACDTDVVTGTGTVTVLLGNGDGTFKTGQDFGVGAVPVSLVVADFNHDGIPDLATANSDSADLSVLFGNGDGSFQPALTIPALESPKSLIVGDFNADGNPDLAFVNGFSYISVLLGNPDGTFQTSITYTNQASSQIVAGDFDGDGNMDLMSVSSTTKFLPGRGDGTFGPAIQVWGSDLYYAIACDLNGDGRLDLAAVVGEGPGAQPSSLVFVLLGNGDGTLQPPTSSVVAGVSNTFLAFGDVNGDRKLDLVANGPGYPGFVSVLLGNGDGTFPSVPGYAGGQEPADMVTGDFNKDGALDIAVGDQTGFVSVLLGNGRGQFGAPTAYSVTGDAFSLVAGDFNGDGIPDLISVSRDTRSVSVLLGKGDGTFLASRSFNLGQRLVKVVAADFNSDRKLDLAVAQDHDALFILLGNGDGTFQSPLTVSVAPQSGNSGLAVGDFNRDGKPDLAVADQANDYVFSFLGNGDGSFRKIGAYHVAPDPASLCVGDFDGDGVIDLASANPYSSNGSVSVFLGQGNGTFASAVEIILGASPVSITSADFNGDGKGDLATVDIANNLAVLLSKGDGTFEHPLFYPASLSPAVIGSGDFNEDQRPDLVFASKSGTQNIGILLNLTR